MIAAADVLAHVLRVNKLMRRAPVLEGDEVDERDWIGFWLGIQIESAWDWDVRVTGVRRVYGPAWLWPDGVPGRTNFGNGEAGTAS